MLSFRATLIALSALILLATPDARASNIVAGVAYESIPLQKSGVADETFQSFPYTLAVQIFPASIIDDGFQPLGWLGLAYDSSKGNQSTQKKAWNVQLGGGLKFHQFYLRGAIHLGSLKLSTPSNGDLSYSDRGGHIGIAYELPLSNSISVQFEIRKVLFSLYGTSNPVFGNAYSGDYFGGLLAMAFKL
jgi:hypothetical protein